jgi:iron complex outermembrane receptor protein
LCLLVAAPAIARAEDDAAEARTLYDRGMAHFRLEEYDQAIEKWQAGFRLRPVPEFLYNIAQAYRLSKRNEKARSFYKKYLDMEPEAPNKAQVLKHIATLDKAIEAEQRASNAPPSDALPRSNTGPMRGPATVNGEPSRPPTPNTPPPSTGEPSGTTTTTAPAVASTPASSDNALTATAPAPRDQRPVYKKPWFWGVVGGAVVVVGVAVVVGVVVGTGGSSRDTIPAARF